MENSWSVEVLLSNGKALSIGDDYVSGSADLSDNDEHLIREAAKSLLAFVGEPPNTKLQNVCACHISDVYRSCHKGEVCRNCHLIVAAQR